VEEDGESVFLLPLDFFSLPFLIASEDLLVVARVTEGERRFGRLRDLDLERLEEEVEREDRDELEEEAEEEV